MEDFIYGLQCAGSFRLARSRRVPIYQIK